MNSTSWWGCRNTPPDNCFRHPHGVVGMLSGVDRFGRDRVPQAPIHKWCSAPDPLARICIGHHPMPPLPLSLPFVVVVNSLTQSTVFKVCEGLKEFLSGENLLKSFLHEIAASHVSSTPNSSTRPSKAKRRAPPLWTISSGTYPGSDEREKKTLREPLADSSTGRGIWHVGCHHVTPFKTKRGRA